MNNYYYGLDIEVCNPAIDDSHRLPDMDIEQFFTDYEAGLRYSTDKRGRIVDNRNILAARALLDSLHPDSEIDSYTDQLLLTDHL